MKETIINIVKEIDNEIRKNKWFDFHFLKYDGITLTIAGSDDLTYYHTLEINFANIFFVSGYFEGLHSDTTKTVFQQPENVKESNEKYEIEVGYQLFIFKTSDYKNDIVIAAKEIKYNTDTVFYYDRPDLKDNERIADFVKRKKT